MTEPGEAFGGPKIVGLGGTLRETSLSRAALERGLIAAERAGAEVALLDVRELKLPMFVPDRPLAGQPPGVQKLIETASTADGFLWSTAGYHGTLAGVTKNALDYLEYLSRESYLDGRPVGLIAVAGGDVAAVGAIEAMVDVTHALRGVVVPLKVPIMKARQAIRPDGTIVDRRTDTRLHMLGEEVVRQAAMRRGSRHPGVEQAAA